MNAATIPDELRLTAPDLARRFGVIITLLAALVARAFLRDPRYVTIIVPLWTRLNRAARRFERIMARLAAGTPSRPSRPGRPSSPRPADARPAEARPFDPRLAALPSTHAWLSQALGSEGRCHASQLNYLLREPGTAALIAASPQAARLLRPLCRILGLDPAILPPRPPRPRREPSEPAGPVAPAAPAPQAVQPPEPPSAPPPEKPRMVLPSCPRMALRWPWVPHPDVKRS